VATMATVAITAAMRKRVERSIDEFLLYRC
jgi:hypothetical protein